jgi:GNAT superfamily N-acetyltransferase
VPELEDLVIEVASPSSAEAGLVLSSYYEELVSRFHGRAATADEVAAAMQAEPSDDLVAPTGLFLLPRRGHQVVGCAGLRLVNAEVAEVTRVYVLAAARRQGIGARLLAALEDAARGLDIAWLRLDTRDDLVEARRLYARRAYKDVAPFNDGLYADRWLGKSLEHPERGQ